MEPPDQQQGQLRQTHADHEQHRAEEQDQSGPDHDDPKRGSANQRKHHHGEGLDKFCAQFDAGCDLYTGYE